MKIYPNRLERASISFEVKIRILKHVEYQNSSNNCQGSTLLLSSKGCVNHFTILRQRTISKTSNGVVGSI